ncbi:MAG TPA: hypothetical protein VKM54_15980 [Myxococcota bacterium]|nr:hypothetical protein [Myxococcota bacterium]
MNDAEAALRNLEAMVKNFEHAFTTQKAALDTLLDQEEQQQKTLERLRRGDDLREVFVESMGKNVLRLEEVVEQQRSVLDQLGIQLRHSREQLRILKRSFGE